MSFASITANREAGLTPAFPSICLQVVEVERMTTALDALSLSKSGVVGIDCRGQRWAFLASSTTSRGSIVNVHQELAVKVPTEVGDQIACSLISAGISAHFVTHTLVPVRSGTNVLVSSEPSRLMELVISMALLKGASVTGEACSEDEMAFLLRAGISDVRSGNERRPNYTFDLAYVGRSPISNLVLEGIKPTGCIVQLKTGDHQRSLNSPFVMRPSLPDIVAGPYEIKARATVAFRMYQEGILEKCFGAET